MRPIPPRLRPRWVISCGALLQRNTSISVPVFRRRTQQQTRGIRSIQGNNPTRSSYNEHPDLPTLASSIAAAIQRRVDSDTLPYRTGAIATKKGMTALFDPETGRRTPCTVLQMDRVQVVAHKTRAQNGYWAVCIGAGWRHPRNVGRAMMGVFASTPIINENGGLEGLPPKQDIKEFRVRDATGLLDIGKTIEPSWFQIGQFIDARATTRGHGFTGGMKRWGFAGQPASHGNSLAHRIMGSSGGSQGSGSRVHPGKKMPGRMGAQRHTTQNLKVLMVDDLNGVVVVNGNVGGKKGALVMIQDALKKPWPKVEPTMIATSTLESISADPAA